MSFLFVPWRQGGLFDKYLTVKSLHCALLVACEAMSRYTEVIILWAMNWIDMVYCHMFQYADRHIWGGGGAANKFPHDAVFPRIIILFLLFFSGEAAKACIERHAENPG